MSAVNYTESLRRKRCSSSDAVTITAADDVPLYSSAGYKKSWSVIQKAVDHLMTESTFPVPPTTLKMREPRHLPKRRVVVNLHRDVLLNNLILKTQAFQKEYEQSGMPFTRQVIIDYPTAAQRPRKERHYEFWPFFEQLPELEEEEQLAPEDIREEEVRDALGFASDNTIEVAEECKENTMYLPISLSDNLTDSISTLFVNVAKDVAPPPPPPPKKKSFVEKFMKKSVLGAVITF